MRLFALLLALLTVSTGAYAAPMCYSADQLEAEQGLRIHSELMVIALNCQHLAGTENLYHEYEDFTRKNLSLIAGYESTMMAMFRSEGDAKPEAKLNTFRTMLANRIANEAVRLQPNVFCHAYGSRIIQANAMSQDQLRRWAQTVFPAYPLTHPVCAGVFVPTQAK